MNGPFFVCCRNVTCEEILEVQSQAEQTRLAGVWACTACAAMPMCVDNANAFQRPRNRGGRPSKNATEAQRNRRAMERELAAHVITPEQPYPLLPGESRLSSLVIYAFEKGHEQGMRAAYRAMQIAGGAK